MTEIELAWLSKTAARQKPGAIWLEIGTWMGRSWSCVALSLPLGSTIIAVDTFRGELAEPLQYVKEHGPVLEKFMKVHEDVRRIRPDLSSQVIAMKSAEAAQFIPNGLCDVIFVDGNHTVDAVAGDVRAYLPKLKRGGLFCGHDIDEAGVKSALNPYKYTRDPIFAGSIWSLL